MEVVEQPTAPPEQVGGIGDQFEGNGAEEARQRRTAKFLRNYRIQEVIHRRQIMLVQVVKEERGSKGAALTTYISLAGRFCVLMPNSPRGGGISRKITSGSDRRRLKEITAELEVPAGMGLIVRTAGAARPKPEIVRDCEYLMQLWDDIRELTLRSIAPALVYEEASLIKRAIRDLYARDVEDITVDGDAGWRAARDFMRMLMPSHARKVQLWKPNGGAASLFAKHGVEAQLDGMLSPTVQLKSGGYLVINQAEALVAIDVNSGRSTRERGIEDTALKTNLEAADEVARQLKLRDLAGLIVIDFIDMEARRHNAAVEKRLKDALKSDRARIQVGSISHFGLLEMSRQRLRPSLAETNFVACPHCGGNGHVRSVESSAIHVLRAIEDEGARGKVALATVHAATPVVLFLLNHKRERLAEIEARTGMRVHFAPDETLVPPQLRIERTRLLTAAPDRVTHVPIGQSAPNGAAAVAEIVDETDLVEDEDPAEEVVEDETGPATAEARETEEGARRRRRRRRRGGRREDGGADQPAANGEPAPTPGEGPQPLIVDSALLAEADAAPAEHLSEALALSDDSERSGARRRGRRGGRRRRREPGDPVISAETPDAETSELEPVIQAYVGPTPADPFGGVAFDIFDALEESEQRSAATAMPPVEPELEVSSPVAAIPEQAPSPEGELTESPPPETPPAGPPRRGWWRRQIGA